MVSVTKSNESESVPKVIAARIAALGYELDPEQLHIGGERQVMNAHKLVLTGRSVADGTRVILKASLDQTGAADIRNEHRVRTLLSEVRFALRELLFPQELLFLDLPDFTLSVTEFIAQERVFVEHPLREQFFMALNWFEAQEEFHATTYEHVRSLHGVLANWNATDYERDVYAIRAAVAASLDSERAHAALSRLAENIHEHSGLINRYSGFLNHTDLVPHNVRIKNRTLYVLDQIAIWFGNKYEGWARFINYMSLHNPPLAHLLLSYVREHRGESDALLLQIMRCYKIGVLLRYYANAVSTTEGNLKKLSSLRFEFWLSALEHILEGAELSNEYINTYKRERDQLRSEEEKQRQREFAQA